MKRLNFILIFISASMTFNAFGKTIIECNSELIRTGNRLTDYYYKIKIDDLYGSQAEFILQEKIVLQDGTGTSEYRVDLDQSLPKEGPRVYSGKFVTLSIQPTPTANSNGKFPGLFTKVDAQRINVIEAFNVNCDFK